MESALTLPQASQRITEYGYVPLSENTGCAEWHFLKGETQLHLFRREREWTAQFVRWNGLHRKESVEFVFPSLSFEIYERSVLSE